MANAPSARGKRGKETSATANKPAAGAASAGGKRGIDLLHDPALNKSTAYTEAMFIEAAHAVAEQVTAEQLKLGMLFPPQSNILETEIKTAARVARLVFEDSLAGVERPEDCEAFIRSHVYKPEYRKLV